jgi:hypothetical protein
VAECAPARAELVVLARSSPEGSTSDRRCSR